MAYIDTSGSLWIWGLITIGDGNKKEYYDRVAPYKVMDNIKEVSLGGCESHVMALDNNGVLYIWGSNLYDQLGLSNYEYSTVPKRLMSGVKHIYAGDRGSYVIKEDNTLWFWGTFYKSEKKKVYKSPIKIADNVIMV